MTVCITMLGPPAGLLVIFCGVDMGPLAITMPENGSRFEPAMGLDGAVCRSGQTDMSVNLNQRLCGLLMVWNFIKNGLDDVSLMIHTVVVRLLGVRKSVRDQSCQICMSKWW